MVEPYPSQFRERKFREEKEGGDLRVGLGGVGHGSATESYQKMNMGGNKEGSRGKYTVNKDRGKQSQVSRVKQGCRSAPNRYGVKRSEEKKAQS